MERRCRLVAISAVIALLVLLGYGSTPAAAVVWTGANPAPLGSPMTPMASPAPDSTWYLPMVFMNYNNPSGWESRIWVQNNWDSAISVDYSVIPNPCSPPCVFLPQPIPARSWSRLPIYPNRSVVAAVKVTGSDANGNPRPIVAYVENYAPNGSTGTYSVQEYYGIPASAGGDYVQASGVVVGGGYSAGTAAQNIGATSTYIHAVFSDVNGNHMCQVTSPTTIAPGASWIIYPLCFSPPASPTLYAAYFWSDNAVPIALVVSVIGDHGMAAAQAVTAGNRFDSSHPQSIQVLTNNWNGTTTGIHCVNPNASPANITITYDGYNGQSDSYTMPAWGSVGFFTNGHLPSGQVSYGNTLRTSGSVICDVIGVHSQPTTLDDFWMYAINNRAYAQSPSQGVAPAHPDQDMDIILTNWAYGWGANPTSIPGNREKVPMIYGDFYCGNYPHNLSSCSKYTNWKNYGTDPGTPDASFNVVTTYSSHILEFNEPDNMEQSAVGCVSASGGTCTQWDFGWVALLMNKIRTGYPSRSLISPAAYNTTWWIEQAHYQYLQNYGSEPWDALGAHCYRPLFDIDNTYGKCIELLNAYISDANTWRVPEVWLTEWNFNYQAINLGYSAVTEERKALDWLAVQPKFTRYAYFTNTYYGDTDGKVKVSCYSGNVGSRDFWMRLFKRGVDGTCTFSGTPVLTDYGKAYWLYR